MRSLLVLIVSVMLANEAAATGDELGERLRFFRWLEDYKTVTETKSTAYQLAPLKRLSLSDQTYPYLTIGGDYRLRYEHHSNQSFALRGDFSTDSVQHRFMLHGDLQFQSARAFIQLSQFDENGQRGGPGPFDESDPDVQQAFVDWRPHWGNVRLGRQEISLGSGKKTGIREGPNQRRAFDGARVTLNIDARGPLDILYAREVRSETEAFEDRSSNGAKLFGVYAKSLFTLNNQVNLDLFYLGIERKNAVFNQGTGDEERHSVGARLWKSAGTLQFDYEATYQFGDFASGDISAWGIATETSFRNVKHKSSARYGVRINLASGDADPNDTDLGTYNVLFSNPSYVSDAAIYAPGNGLDVQPFVEFRPHPAVTIFSGVDFQWRLRRGDAVYANPGVPLIGDDVSDAHFNAWLINIVATWTPSPFVTLNAAYVHNDAGELVRDAGGRDTDFLLFSIGARF